MASRHRGYATVSALVAVVQAWRRIAGLPVQVGAVQVPHAASAAIALPCAGLAARGWRSR